ncbi:MAG TPA: aminotransferase class I/II-fold pyridoxal phosphate-dependent enzyme, partial [Thermotoga sp.]|nr:aminotransferase class I/II-fold pyridoxal phosphate-dependent enzyme [Thermotoga sp.]
NSPNNPTGVVYPPEVIRCISELTNKYGLFVISDEIYSELVYEGTYHSTLEFFDRDKLIVVNGFSKSHAMTGWRIGYVIAPKEISEAIAKIQSHTTSNVNSITQRAVLKAFEVDISYMREEFKKRKNVVSKELKKIGLDFVEPKGAFYFFFKTPYDDAIFCNDLLVAKKVALVPGTSFEYPGFARLSFAVSLDTLKEGMRRIYEFFK